MAIFGEDILGINGTVIYEATSVDKVLDHVFVVWILVLFIVSSVCNPIVFWYHRRMKQNTPAILFQILTANDFLTCVLVAPVMVYYLVAKVNLVLTFRTCIHTKLKSIWNFASSNISKMIFLLFIYILFTQVSSSVQQFVTLFSSDTTWPGKSGRTPSLADLLLDYQGINVLLVVLSDGYSRNSKMHRNPLPLLADQKSPGIKHRCWSRHVFNQYFSSYFLQWRWPRLELILSSGLWLHNVSCPHRWLR